MNINTKIMSLNEIRLYLYHFENLKKDIDSLQAELDIHNKNDASTIKAQMITDMPIGRNAPDQKGEIWNSQTEKAAIKRAEYTLSLTDDIESKLKIIRAVQSIYFYLKEPKRSIFEMRYFIKEEPPWKIISKEVNETEGNCKRIDGRIIKTIQKKLFKL